MKCKICNAEMSEGIALVDNVSGIPDFVGDTHCCTVSPNGTARLVPCLKCHECGMSIGWRAVDIVPEANNQKLCQLLSTK